MKTLTGKPWKLVVMNRHFPWVAERVASSHDTLEEAAEAMAREGRFGSVTVSGPDGRSLQPCDVDALVATYKDGFCVYLIVDDPDYYGKQHFWGFWKGLVGPGQGEIGVRGQYFRAKLSDYTTQTFLSGQLKRSEVYDFRKMGVTEQEAMRRCEDRVREVTGLPMKGAKAC